eukprot:366030-Chlamydomonas_euryale.AAC.12
MMPLHLLQFRRLQQRTASVVATGPHWLMNADQWCEASRGLRPGALRAASSASTARRKRGQRAAKAAGRPRARELACARTRGGDAE